jgi:glycosyltransferase involved in cell wall biosynthesis
MKPIKFLIVVPTLNDSKRLNRLICSLQEQTHRLWKLLLVDGGSDGVHTSEMLAMAEREVRILVEKEDVSDPGIFGAMNVGLKYARQLDDEDRWLLFWGSDDYAASSGMLEGVASYINHESQMSGIKRSECDLVIGCGRYINTKGKKGRLSSFSKKQTIDGAGFKKLLQYGYSPAHQATFIGPRVPHRLPYYSRSLKLAADLDYYMKATDVDFNIMVNDHLVVIMGNDGISARNTKKRLAEVMYVYISTFGWGCGVPLVLRYLRKFGQKLKGLLV